jgi:phosphopantetheine adenylyltransferase
MASGQYDSLTVDHVHAVAQREHLFESLVIWLGADGERLSVIRQDDRTALNAMFARMVLVVTPDDFGIDRSGPHAALAFVMGMLLKGINDVVREHDTPEQQH